MVVVIAMATMPGSVMVLPIHLQLGVGVSTMVTGVLLLPGGLIQGVGSPAAPRSARSPAEWFSSWPAPPVPRS